MERLTETRPKISLAILFLGLAAASFATAADLNVPADYPTIQAAVNAAQTNDTIHIAPGVYTGQVQVISKTLTLVGQPGTILRATTNMSSFPGSIHIPIIGIRSSQVTVRGLTFEGERLAERFVGPGDLQALYLRQSSGIVENCAFYGFRESTPGNEFGTAIGVQNAEDNATEVNLRLVGSTFADNYDGIYFIGSPTKQSINVTVENNTFVGPGPLNLSDSNFGIYIREGVGGRIAGNTISGFSYVGTKAPFPISFGILADNEANYPPVFGHLQPFTIEGNTLRDNQFHIALVKGDKSEVRNNRFQGTAPGIIPVGLAITGTNVTIANNRFENMEEGIRLMGNDPNWGTLLGIAVDAQVTSNRFCGVTTPVTLQPLASATEAGTLVICPIPPPPLAIAPAVFLSWPGEDDGWTVESATSVDGPWAASDATPFTQYGRHCIAAPTDGQRRFFRLR
jgi:nitrous oxidase accessory protein NosD